MGVRREPILVSNIQLSILQDSIFTTNGGVGNYRTTMPLNGRSIRMREAVAENAPLRESDDSDIKGPTTAAEGRKFRATKWAKDAFRIATASVDYIRDLDR